MLTCSIVGARPQFVKLAPVCRAIERHNARASKPIQDLIVHTGQHYDPGMSDVFFEELRIPRADLHLGVGSGSHGAMTGRMLEALEKVFVERRPDAVVVYGDTNSTVAGALAAAKLGIRVIHVEAGLRSFNRVMPEELNRIATDHLADRLLAPTPTALMNLGAEGLGARSVLTGDVMYDAVLFNRELARASSKIHAQLGTGDGRYGVLTIHRAENTHAAELRKLLDTINAVVAGGLRIVCPLHPRTRKMLAGELADWQPASGLQVIDPLGYLDMLALVDRAALVLTDSGGLQKEAFFLGKPCVTLRTETEWVETVHAGGNVVAGIERNSVLAAVQHFLGGGFPGVTAERIAQAFGCGDAADRIVSEIHASAG